MVTSKQQTEHNSAPLRRGLSLAAWRRMLFNSSPKYWALALVLLVCNLLAFLPRGVLIVLGKVLGLVIYTFSPKLRHIAKSNIDACFGRLAENSRLKLEKSSFKELGVSVMETLMIWFCNVETLYRKKAHIAGEENLNAALAQDRGIILLACHQGSLDMSASFGSFVFRPHRKYSFTYRQPSDRLVDFFLRQARGKFGDNFFSVNNLVGILRALKRGGVVWYAPDIEVKNKNTVYVDFFGVPASTTMALVRIAQSSNALVLPYGHYRNEDGSYTLQFYPLLDNFPSGDDVADTLTMNQAIETIVEPYPDRYWWVIKRFKNRPEGEAKLY